MSVWVSQLKDRAPDGLRRQPSQGTGSLENAMLQFGVLVSRRMWKSLVKIGR